MVCIHLFNEKPCSFQFFICSTLHLSSSSPSLMIPYFSNRICTSEKENSVYAPENAFDLRSGEGSEVHTPTDGALSLALLLVPALLRVGIRFFPTSLAQIGRYGGVWSLESWRTEMEVPAGGRYGGGREAPGGSIGGGEE